MTREKGFQLGKWIGLVIGSVTIFGFLVSGMGKIYAEDTRLGAVEDKAAMLPCVLWDLQILKGDARGRNPIRYDSLIENQIKVSGPRPQVKERE